MQVESIQINQTKIPMLFGMGALLKMESLQIDSSNSFKQIAGWAYAAHLNYCDLKEEEPLFDFKQALLLFNSMSTVQLTKIMNLSQEMMKIESNDKKSDAQD